MHADMVGATLNPILKKNDKPILVVTLDQDGTTRRFCGKFQAWNSQDGELWLQNEGKLVKCLHAFEIISVNEITEAGLIDNTNVLFGIIELAGKTLC